MIRSSVSLIRTGRELPWQRAKMSQVQSCTRCQWNLVNSLRFWRSRSCYTLKEGRDRGRVEGSSGGVGGGVVRECVRVRVGAGRVGGWEAYIQSRSSATGFWHKLCALCSISCFKWDWVSEQKSFLLKTQITTLVTKWDCFLIDITY